MLGEEFQFQIGTIDSLYCAVAVGAANWFQFQIGTIDS